jgi:hypothetical protein
MRREVIIEGYSSYCEQKETSCIIYYRRGKITEGEIDE